MQDLNRRIRAAHAVSRIREFPAPETVTARRQSGVQVTSPSPVLPTLLPTAQPVTDGVARMGAIVPMDGQNRIAAGKLAKPLGWQAGASLVARCAGDRVTVTAGPAASPADAPVTLDSDRRLTLPAAAVAVLGLRAGGQAVAVAVPATGELMLLSATAALAQLTGPLTVPAAADAAVTPGPADRPASRIRKRWQPPEVA